MVQAPTKKFVVNFVQVPTKKIVVNFLQGFLVFSFWWYVTCNTIYSLYWLAEDPSNFVEVQEKDEVVEEEEADDTDAEEDKDAEETN